MSSHPSNVTFVAYFHMVLLCLLRAIRCTAAKYAPHWRLAANHEEVAEMLTKFCRMARNTCLAAFYGGHCPNVGCLFNFWCKVLPNCAMQEKVQDGGMYDEFLGSIKYPKNVL